MKIVHNFYLTFFLLVMNIALPSYSLNIDTILVREEKLSLENEYVNIHHNHKPNSSNNLYSVGDKLYVEFSRLKPTQLRKSSANVDDKIARSKGLIYDDGKSMFSLKEAIPVFKGLDGLLYLIDGHHSVLASIESKAKTIPVVILDDLSDLEEKEFWKIAKNKNYTYLKDFNGIDQLPLTSFSDLIEDPVRYFVAISAFKCTSDKSLNNQEFEKYSIHPLWVKTIESPAFIEFIIANILYKNNFKFNNKDRFDKKLLAQQVEEARKILSSFPAENIILLPHDKVNTQKILLKHCVGEINLKDFISSK